VLESIDLASLLADAARLILGPAMSIQAPPNLRKTTHRAPSLRAVIGRLRLGTRLAASF
jgi:hypothetical protein